MTFRDNLANWTARVVPEGLRRVSWMRPKYPLVAVEIREDALVAVRLQKRGTGYRLAGYGRKSLPAGAFSASLMNPGVGDPAALRDAIGDALRLAGAEGAGRISVAVPDTAVRVFIADVAELPASRAQADEMVRFRIRKSIPFRPEESRMSWDVVGRDAEGRVQCLVAVAPDRALRPLEEALREGGVRCGLIDLATFDLYNALRLDGWIPDGAPAGAPEPDGDVAVLNATAAYFSLMIVRGGVPVFYRSKNYHVSSGFQGEESLRVVGRELRSSVGYYEEHLLGQGIRTVVVRAAGVPTDGVVDAVREAGFGDVQLASVQRVLPEMKDVPPETAIELLPAIGLALRRAA